MNFVLFTVEREKTTRCSPQKERFLAAIKTNIFQIASRAEDTRTVARFPSAAFVRVQIAGPAD